jgi:LPS sulfotransferase NodH
MSQPSTQSVAEPVQTDRNLPYVICYTSRSGSTLLCEVLLNTGVAGKPKEYFHLADIEMRSRQWEVEVGAAFLRRLRAEGSTPNGVFGSKMSLDQLDSVRQMVQSTVDGGDLSAAQALETFLPGVRYIFITRRNKVRQAVSIWKLIQEKVPFQVGEQSGQRSVKTHYNFSVIDRATQEVMLNEASWDDFFEQAGIAPLTIVYEDLVEDIEGTVRRVLDFLHVDAPDQLKLPPPRLQKQANSLSEMWVRRYMTEKYAYLPTRALPRYLLRLVADRAFDFDLLREIVRHRLAPPGTAGSPGRDWEQEIREAERREGGR